LVLRYFTSGENESRQHHSIRFNSVWQAIPLIAVTDLAFSLDSVTTSIAVSDQVWLILLGGTAGVITLRFLAGLFIRWLDEYTHLEDAGFVTVGFVGLRLLVRVINEDYIPPEWLMISAIVVIFIWGFSEKNPEEDLNP
jgi:predicted tellurium resistance membrane protein TerC